MLGLQVTLASARAKRLVFPLEKLRGIFCQMYALICNFAKCLGLDLQEVLP